MPLVRDAGNRELESHVESRAIGILKAGLRVIQHPEPRVWTSGVALSTQSVRLCEASQQRGSISTGVVDAFTPGHRFIVAKVQDPDVALKLLPEDLAINPERLARLEREAQMVAAMNHPNIAAI